MPEYRLQFPHGEIVSSSYTSLKHRLSKEKDFWSDFEQLNWGSRVLGHSAAQSASDELGRVRNLITNVELLCERIDQIDGRTFDTEFPGFKSWVEDLELPPVSTSSFAISLREGLGQGKIQEVTMAILGFCLKQYNRSNLNLNNASERGAYYGSILASYASLSLQLEREYPASVLDEETVLKAREAKELFDEAGVAADQLRKRQHEIEEDIVEFESHYQDRFRKVDKLAVARTRKIHRILLRHERNREKEFETLQTTFNSHLRLKRPVELWEDRKQEHDKASRTHLFVFAVFAIALVICTGVVSIGYGDEIATAFLRFECGIDRSEVCDGISPKGPLLISSIILVSAVWLWFLRLQMRLYLSQRHLSLDARERMAFAETYLSLLKGDEVTAEHEAVVLQSLFRPTQDGIVKDDVGPDLGLAGNLSNMLDRQK